MKGAEIAKKVMLSGLMVLAWGTAILESHAGPRSATRTTVAAGRMGRQDLRQERRIARQDRRQDRIEQRRLPSATTPVLTQGAKKAKTKSQTKSRVLVVKPR